MFTGIVQAVGAVASLAGGRLVLTDPGAWPGDPWVLGESVAVNGVCLTLVGATGGLAFDLSPETLARSTLGRLAPGRPVNLERAMRPADRFGGHIVQGHVDATGSLVSATPVAGAVVMRFACPDPAQGRYLVDKGSVTLDGVSLTVVDPDGPEFDVSVVPHTWEVTALRWLAPGDPVNIEFDVLARYVERLIAPG